MLLANMAKSDSFSRLCTLKRSVVPKLSASLLALDQLIDLFNRGADAHYNTAANFDYLAYLFADLAKVSLSFPHGQPSANCLSPQHPQITTHLLTPTPHDPSLPPLTAFLPFTTHSSHIRRLGVSSLLKNIALSHSSPRFLLQPPLSVLPQLLLPLCGPDPSFTEVETEELLAELQFLGPEHRREEDIKIIRNHLETLFLIVTKGGEMGKNTIKEAGAYVIIRELHLEVEDEAVREVCERVVQVLMGDEVDGEDTQNRQRRLGAASGGSMVTQREAEEDDDDQIVEIF